MAGTGRKRKHSIVQREDLIEAKVVRFYYQLPLAKEHL